jgi:hypothetical protein
MNDNLPPDFTAWQRENLDRLAFDLWHDNKRLREDNKALHEAWREELRRKANEPQ